MEDLISKDKTSDKADLILFFVDLPGYGWAKTSKKNRESWDNMTKDYLLNSDKIALIFILIDIRLKPQEIDINYINYLGKNKYFSRHIFY